MKRAKDIIWIIVGWGLSRWSIYKMHFEDTNFRKDGWNGIKWQEIHSQTRLAIPSQYLAGILFVFVLFEWGIICFAVYSFLSLFSPSIVTLAIHFPLWGYSKYIWMLNSHCICCNEHLDDIAFHPNEVRWLMKVSSVLQISEHLTLYCSLIDPADDAVKCGPKPECNTRYCTHCQVCSTIWSSQTKKSSLLQWNKCSFM